MGVGSRKHKGPVLAQSSNPHHIARSLLAMRPAQSTSPLRQTEGHLKLVISHAQNAKLREKVKGANQGPKRVGASKPPARLKAFSGISGSNKLGGKKQKMAAAREAALAFIGSSHKGKHKQHFAY
jgi:hypothetical protein